MRDFPDGTTGLAVEGHEERILALLSVARRELTDAGVLKKFRSASRALRQGETGRAAITLCHVGQPRLVDDGYAKVLDAAANRSDWGVRPFDLLKGLGLLAAGDSRGAWRAFVAAADSAWRKDCESGKTQDRDDHGRYVCEGGADITAENGKKVVAEAKKWEDTPYAPRGTAHAGANPVRGGKGSADCSGSVWAILGNAGYHYHYTTSGDFASAVATGKIPFRELGSGEEPQPGDVVLYPGHMSVYAGDRRVWSAHRTEKNFDNFPVTYFRGKTKYYRYQAKGPTR